MSASIQGASELLRGRTSLKCLDYRESLRAAKPGDIVYMDPPYQGVCGTRDNRYLGSVPYDEFAEALAHLNDRGISYIVSYDGRTGARAYGRKLPDSLRLVHIEIDAGRSTQATLLGRDCRTYESLYLSPALMLRIGDVPHALRGHTEQPVLLLG